MISQKNIQKYSLSFALIGLLLPLRFSNVALGIFLLVSLISFFKTKNKQLLKHQILITGFFLLFPIALLYTDDSSYALKIIERNIVWLVIPILVPLTLKITTKQIFYSFFRFSVAVHTLLLLLIAIAIKNYFFTKDILVFYYDGFTQSINFHPVYLSVYVLFALLILIESWKKNYWNPKIHIKILIIVADLIFLILLSSKIILASFLIVLLFTMVRSKQNRKRIWLYIIALCFVVLAMFQFSETKNRINDTLHSSWELLDKETFNYNDPFTGITLRLITWKFVMQDFIKNENIFIGLGTGDAKSFINNVYKKRNMDAAGYTNFNMHNQYLEYLLKFGFVGFVYFLTILFLSFKKAISQQNDLYLYFLLIFCIFSITESTLEVQRGILFFVLINTVFFFSSYPESKQINE